MHRFSRFRLSTLREVEGRKAQNVNDNRKKYVHTKVEEKGGGVKPYMVMRQLTLNVVCGIVPSEWLRGHCFAFDRSILPLMFSMWPTQLRRQAKMELPSLFSFKVLVFNNEGSAQLVLLSV